MTSGIALAEDPATAERVPTPPTPSPASRPRKRTRVIVQRVVAVVLFVLLARAVLTNDALRWDVVGTYLTNGFVLDGLLTTIYLTVLSLAISIVLGVGLAVAQMSGGPLLAGFSRGYIELLRAIPPLLQILFWFNLAIFLPRLEISIPFTDIAFGGATNEIISPLTAAVIALGLNEAAYMAEVVRSGLQAVPPTQVDAAASLGMGRRARFRHVILPQAFTVMLPPLGNQTISLLKGTSLVAMVGVGDLMTNVQRIYNQNFLIIPLLVVASIWYIALTLVITSGQVWLENRFAHERVRTYPGERIAGRVVAALRSVVRRVRGSAPEARA